jgi:hypothetical protein
MNIGNVGPQSPASAILGGATLPSTPTARQVFAKTSGGSTGMYVCLTNGAWTGPFATSSGSGDVVGPGSSTDNAIARFDSTTGKLIQNSGVIVSDTNTVALPGSTSGTSTVTAPAIAGTSTITLPNASSTLPIFGQQITFSGPTAARTVTLPDASFTAARTDAGNSWTGNQIFSSDNAYSIGATNASRPNAVFVAGNVYAQGFESRLNASSTRTAFFENTGADTILAFETNSGRINFNRSAGIANPASGVTEINNGTAAQPGVLLLRGQTFASLPASPIAGMFATVTDSTTTTYGATITGSGANTVLAWYNGSNWTVH